MTKTPLLLCIDTGDGNHDFSLNVIEPAWNDYIYSAKPSDIDENASLVWLAETQGFSYEEFKQALTECADKTKSHPSKFIRSVYQELENLTTSIAMLVFVMQTDDYEEHMKCVNEKTNTFNIPKDTLCGLINHVNGSGSILEIELDKDIENVGMDVVAHFGEDGAFWYGLRDIYGVDEDFFTSTVVWND